MSEIQRLLEIMADLRNPETGCPWDVKQDFSSIAPYTIEEAYEVADAVQRNDMDGLRDELGDLLLQVVFHAQMASEAGLFSFEDVARSINDKMVRRHPHVFADARIDSADDQLASWESIKQQERGTDTDSSALAGLTRGLPEWMKAGKLHSRAARVGFDWPDAAAVLDKVDEELTELREAIKRPEHPNHCEEELGDLLFALMALSRHLKLEPGRALSGANLKFEQRFRAMERLVEQRGSAISDLDLAALDQLWEQAKSELSGHGAEPTSGSDGG